MKRARIIVHGLVQGVFFRHNTNKLSNKLGLKGYVRNLSNGAVEIVAEGPEKDIKELISFCKKGPQGASVSGVKVEYEAPTNGFSRFSIEY